MIFKILSKRPEMSPICPGQKAGKLFAKGLNCTQAVLQATTGRTDKDIMKMAKAFGGGISDRKCLCGAITGGLMALGLNGKGNKSGELIDHFRKDQGATCCVALSRGLKWKSKEHLNNCRRITEETAKTVSKLL
jgi:C_GCAxxG_C_C family probable redox protein